jgi:hypothetical protein
MGSEKMGHWFVGRIHVDRETINDRIPVTTHVVRLKLFRLKAEGVRKTRLPYFGGNI